MADSEGTGHPLSLKVMRVSRPNLASHWQPFFSTSPSLSSHATASPLILQGSEPLPGHPKTLRDLTVASPFLTLPASFGGIQLGETFACVLSVNNEAGRDVDEVCVRVEMQTATGKVLLEEMRAGGLASGEEGRNVLGKGDSMELCVSSEIKEIGQHVLGCTVTYRTPPGMQPATSGSGDASDPFVQTFRKFYKFLVTNPLSVKTKVHVPQSPSALILEKERDKVFLEVHIQNLTPSPLWFERIRLEPVDGWHVLDVNTISGVESNGQEQKDAKSLFSGSMALMHSKDMRQYIYILTPNSTPKTMVPATPAPGTIIPLGRLDICWRSPMGEPGRLLTSVLSRRIPMPPAPPMTTGLPAPPASAVPHYLQKSIGVNQPRSRSPSLQQRSGTPPPASPVKRPTTPGTVPYPQSPGINAPPVPPLSQAVSPQSDLEVDILLLSGPTDSTVDLGESFSLTFRVAVSGLLPGGTSELLGNQPARKVRSISLAVQHTFPSLSSGRSVPDTKPALAAPVLKRHGSRILMSDGVPGSPGMQSPSSHTGSIDMLTPRRVVSPPPGGPTAIITAPSVVRSESHTGPPLATQAGEVALGGLEERLRRIALSEALGVEDEGRRSTFGEEAEDLDLASGFNIRLPRPYRTVDERKARAKGSDNVVVVGCSAQFLPSIELREISTKDKDALGSVPGSVRDRGEGKAEFNLLYSAKKRGFASVGGLRILLVKDEEKLAESEEDGESVTLHAQGSVQQSEASILREWDVVAELWIR